MNIGRSFPTTLGTSGPESLRRLFIVMKCLDSPGGICHATAKHARVSARARPCVCRSRSARSNYFCCQWRRLDFYVSRKILCVRSLAFCGMDLVLGECSSISVSVSFYYDISSQARDYSDSHSSNVELTHSLFVFSTNALFLFFLSYFITPVKAVRHSKPKETTNKIKLCQFLPFRLMPCTNVNNIQ